jgi:hypothetical protein
MGITREQKINKILEKEKDFEWATDSFKCWTSSEFVRNKVNDSKFCFSSSGINEVYHCSYFLSAFSKDSHDEYEMNSSLFMSKYKCFLDWLCEQKEKNNSILKEVEEIGIDG